MSITTLVSAGGAPGVTTTALGMALLWPRNCLLVDADPCPNQSILAGYLGGRIDASGRGLPWIAEAYRRAVPLDEVIVEQSIALPGWPWKLPKGHLTGGSTAGDGSSTGDGAATGNRSVGSGKHGSLPARGARFVPGYTHPGTSGMFAHVWGAFAAALVKMDETLGCDAIIDLGRLGADGIPRPLLEASQQVLFVMRSSLRGLAGVRLHAETLREAAERVGKARSLSLLVVGPDAPYSVTEISSQFSLPVLASVPCLPTEARVLSDGGTGGGRGNQRRLSSSYSKLGSLLHEQNALWAARLRTRASRVDLSWDDAAETGDVSGLQRPDFAQVSGS